MTTSLQTFRTDLSNGLLNFIWRQWRAMGVSGSLPGHDDWLIDPESVLAFTTEIARRDARVFDEFLDWIACNGQWINVQRLSTNVQHDGAGCKAAVGAIAAWLADRDRSAKWRGLAHRMKTEACHPAEALFQSYPKGTLPVFEQCDQYFERYGLLRQPVDIRGMTQPVNMAAPGNAMFKSRAVFGIGIRADVIMYLLTTDGGHSRRIASLLGYNHMRVRELLVGLAEAGVVTMRPVGRAKHYWIDKDRWRPVLLERSEIPRWIDWRALIRGLSVIWRETWSIDEERADDYIFSSNMRMAVRTARDDLHASGAGIEIEEDRGHIAEDYLPVFLANMSRMLATLNGEQ